MPGLLRNLFVALAAAMLGACGESGGIGGDTAPGAGDDSMGTGTLSVKLTDAPASPELAKVFVTVERLRVHRAETDDEGDAGWSEIVLDPPRKIDLLTLRNGASEDLGQLRLAEGSYAQLRLVLGKGPADNTVVLASDPGVEIPMRTPSGQQDGLKLVHPFRVSAGGTVELTLDFDAARSVVMVGAGGEAAPDPAAPAAPAASASPAPASVSTGGGPVTKPIIAAESGQRVTKPVAAAAPAASGDAGSRPLLKPAITVIPTVDDGLPASGAMAGAFDDDSANGATVSLQAYDRATGTVTVKRSTVVDNRRWTLDPVPPGGGYQLVIAKTGHRTVVLTGIDVAAGAAIGPVTLGPLEAATTLRTASGSVAPADPAAGRHALVRALQRVAEGAGAASEVVVEVTVVTTPVDTGAFALTLPVDAAKVARFATGSPAFVPGGNAGRYVLEARGLDEAAGAGVLAFDAGSAESAGKLTIAAAR